MESSNIIIKLGWIAVSQAKVKPCFSRYLWCLYRISTAFIVWKHSQNSKHSVCTRDAILQSDPLVPKKSFQGLNQFSYFPLKLFRCWPVRLKCKLGRIATPENYASSFPTDLAAYNELWWFSIIVWYTLPNISYQDHYT